jgi:beta-carotene hydroxylase
MQPISLPPSLSQKSNVKAVLGCLYAVFIYFGAWWGVYEILRMESLPWWGKALAAIPALIIGGYGMLLMGFMGHDGTHFSLHDNRVVSALLGIILTAPIFPYMVMGFTISHWNHHKFTNSDNDPDSVMFSRFKNLFSRAFLARPYSFLEYGTNTLRLALGLPLPFSYQFPLSRSTVRRLALFNVALSLFFGGIYFAVALANPLAGLALAALYLFGTAISGLSPYIEHTGTGKGRGVDTRTADGWWWDILILGNNYHVEHHLFPTVPFYNLKKAHQYLKSIGFYEETKHLSHGVVGTYRYALSRYPYPS